VIRALIVDDEPPARRRLRQLLADDPEVELAGECAGGREAVALIRSLQPDLVLLDVQMPGMSGFDVLASLDRAHWPHVVFVTAHDAYAVRAFEVHALDYVLKPVSRARVREALARAKRAVAHDRRADASDKLARALQDLRGPAPPGRIAVKVDGRVLLLHTGEIRWVEAAGNYARLHLGGASHLVREPLKDLLARLGPERFVRVHRSAAVNLDAVREFRPWFKGASVVVLDDGTRLTVSRGPRAALERALDALP